MCTIKYCSKFNTRYEVYIRNTSLSLLMSRAGTALRPKTISGGTTLSKIQNQIQDGEYNTTIYTLIKNHDYTDAIDILLQQYESSYSKSRATLSLLGYCYYHIEEFAKASEMYGQLVEFYPSVEEYAIYYAQCLYKAGMYIEAQTSCVNIESEQYGHKIKKLQATISYEMDELQQAQHFLEQCIVDDSDLIVLQGCVCFKLGKYEEALSHFQKAVNSLGAKPHLMYNLALMNYKLGHYEIALQHINELIKIGAKEHPELAIGSMTDGIETKSVGNTQSLRETALIEAFNLKSAIKYMLKNITGAKEALTDMPPRDESELDPVTLHNSALVNMDEDPTTGFKKFNYLLQNPPFPPETFQNLLLFYIQFKYYDLTADVLAENSHLSWQYLHQENQILYDFLDGMITTQTSPAEGYHKFNMLATKHIEGLRKLTKKVQDSKNSEDKIILKKTIAEYDKALEEYISVLMAQANIYWNLQNYPMVEKIFRQSAEFASEHECWKLNVAHVFFMQGTKFREAIRYYEPIVENYHDNLLDCSAIVLANLCVSYIMTSMNEKAEEIMQHLEREEEKLSISQPDKQPLHLCIVNLVIGTLYCSKGNYEFGINRIIKSLEPYHKKIMTDTWFYAKRCLLAFASAISKHLTSIKQSSKLELIMFLDQAELYGDKIPAFIPLDPTETSDKIKTVKEEVRILKKMFIVLFE